MSFIFQENFTLLLPDFTESKIEFSESFNSKHGLIIEVAAIHEGLTSNYNNYSAEELEKALQSWVEPYPKPIILNHDLNNEAIGRVMAAKMDKESDGTSFVRLQIAITDPVAAQKVLDKRYLTGSVGGAAAKAICSITGEDLAEQDDSGRPKAIKYKKGKVYKGKLAYIDMQNISFREYSFVNQPADQRSGVRSAILPTDGKADIAHSDNWVAKSSAFVLSMDTEDVISISENKSLFENMKKKESKPLYLHLKGSFLTALAVHETQNDFNNLINSSESLLCDEDSENINSEEKSTMEKDERNEEDILAVATGLSEDLSNIAATSVNAEEGDETDEEVAEKEVEKAVDETSSENDLSDSDSIVENEETDSPVVENEEDTISSEESEETSKEEAVKEDLSSKVVELENVIEQLNKKITSLEEKNEKLKKALHMTLVERVIDTKISLGLESVEDRERLISEHEDRTASSLADSLRDLAKLPAIKQKTGLVPEISNEAVADTTEENVFTLTESVEDGIESVKVDPAEQLFVDALMGRRKL
jgi:hypothetical protein